MKGLFKPLSLFALLIILFAFSLNVNAQEKKTDNSEPTYVVEEEQAIFPGGGDTIGGYDAVQKIIYDNIQYPQEALDKKIQGEVILSFIVEKDGSIGEVKVLKDIGYGCGEEAKRIVKLMPKWKPAKHRGKAVRQQFTLPVIFDLTTNEE
ncbi:MAG: outer rane transport energization protein TonB [Bacteroidetes bacterium]|nr:outer rane transport energization protein TonB [Bacteroidota bacterium]